MPATGPILLVEPQPAECDEDEDADERDDDEWGWPVNGEYIVGRIEIRELDDGGGGGGGGTDAIKLATMTVGPAPVDPFVSNRPWSCKCWCCDICRLGGGGGNGW